jgi:hypothetical protein
MNLFFSKAFSNNACLFVEYVVYNYKTQHVWSGTRCLPWKLKENLIYFRSLDNKKNY